MCDCLVCQPKHRLTLAEWCEKSGISPTHPTTEMGAVSVICDPVGRWKRWRNELYKLVDYVVSGSGGVVVWLVPRVKKTT